MQEVCKDGSWTESIADIKETALVLQKWEREGLRQYGKGNTARARKMIDFMDVLCYNLV